MVNNLNDRINCETGELNPPIGMAEAGHEDSEEAATGGAAFTKEFGRGFKAGRESAQQIERTEPSRGAPDAQEVSAKLLTGQQFIESNYTWNEHLHEYLCETDANGDGSYEGIAEAYAYYRLQRETEKLKSGHVVLLEALRRLAETTRNCLVQFRDFADDKTSETALLHSSGELGSALVEAEAAIQQAERT